MQPDMQAFQWTRQPESYLIGENRVEIVTPPHTDLWQRTYYGFRNDNAPVLQMRTAEKYFSFVVRTEFDSRARFDQCGIVLYLDSENWLKASVEYENEQIQHLGSVVTNHGYSDWATTEIPASVRVMWYQTERRSVRCAFAIYGKAAAKSNLVFTRAARRTLLSVQFLLT